MWSIKSRSLCADCYSYAYMWGLSSCYYRSRPIFGVFLSVTSPLGEYALNSHGTHFAGYTTMLLLCDSGAVDPLLLADQPCRLVVYITDKDVRASWQWTCGGTLPWDFFVPWRQRSCCCIMYFYRPIRKWWTPTWQTIPVFNKEDSLCGDNVHSVTLCHVQRQLSPRLVSWLVLLNRRLDDRVNCGNEACYSVIH